MDLVILGVVDSRSSSRFPTSSERITVVEWVWISAWYLSPPIADSPAAGPRLVTPALDDTGAFGFFVVASTLGLVVAGG